VNTSLDSQRLPQRLFLLDIFRYVLVFAIVAFHLYEFTFDSDAFPIEFSKFLIFDKVSFICRFLTFGGQSLIALSVFLLGFKQIDNSKLIKLFLIFALGYIAVVFSFYDVENRKLIDWDLYPFLIISFLSILILQKYAFLVKYFCIIGVSLFLLPYRELAMALTESWAKEAIFGICHNDHFTSWPLVPWIGMIWIFYGLGELAMKHHDVLKKITKMEVIVYSVILFVAIPQLRYFGSVPVSSRLYCFVQLAPPLVTASFLALTLIVIRFSLVHNINQFIGDRKYLNFFTQSFWSQNLGIAYIVHLVYIGWVSDFKEVYLAKPIFLEFAFFGCFVFVELVYLLFKVVFNRSVFKKLRPGTR